MRGIRWPSDLCPVVSPRRFLCGVFLLFAWSLGSADNYTHTAITYSHFQGIRNIWQVDCSGEGLVEASADVLTVSMYDPVDSKVIASANLKNKDCTTSATFSLCIIDAKGHGTKVTTLILDLGNEPKVYGCNVTVTKAGTTHIQSYKVPVGPTTVTVSTIAMLTSTTAEIPSGFNKDTSTPVASGSTEHSTDLYDIHPGILITALLILLFFIILSIILLIMHIKERRRRHYLAEEYDTPLPIKSEYAVPGAGPRGAAGEKERILAAGGRSPRPSTSSPLPHHVRKGSGAGSGGGGSMRYQQTGATGGILHDDSPGYLAGHNISVYYAEPWSGADSEREAKVRTPFPRALPSHYGQIPHELKSRGTPPHHHHAHGHHGHQVPHELRGLAGRLGGGGSGGGGGSSTPPIPHYAQIPHELKAGIRATPTHGGQTSASSSSSAAAAAAATHESKGGLLTSSAPPAEDNP